MECQADLFQVVLALRPQPRFTGSLDGGQEKSDQNSEKDQSRADFNEGLHRPAS
jgi:hypothetical protein